MYIRPVVALLVAALIAPTLAGAQVPGVPAAPPPGGAPQAERDFRYSELLSAIERGEVRDAVLDPSRAEVSVRLDGGREETLGYPPDKTSPTVSPSAVPPSTSLRRTAGRAPDSSASPCWG